MNARFMILNRNADYVKVTIKPGQSLNWGYFEYTDEGWTSHHVQWTHDGEDVHLVVVNDGRDCDGRLTRSIEYVCPVARLSAWENREGIKMPDWTEVSYDQCDQYAEMAGY